MHILHVVPSLGPLRGGPSFTARALVSGLARAGIAVDIATTDDNGPGRLQVLLGQPQSEGGVSYWYFARQTRFYTVSWPLARWLDSHVAEYDLVHIHALFSFASLAAAACAARHRVPYIVRPLGTLSRWGMRHRRPWLKQISWQLFERHVLARAAAIHYTSEQERVEAAELGYDYRAVVISNPVEIDQTAVVLNRGELRRRYPQLAQRTIVLFLARLDPKKGFDLLLPAFAQAHAQRPDLALIIVGDGDPAYVASLRAEAVRIGVAEHVVWAGFLAGDAKLAALADADLFVLPSYSENFGNAVVEALACGLPVVISDQVGVQQEVSAAKAGLVVPCQVADLAAAIVQLAADPALRQAMGARGRHLAKERFSPQAVTAQLQDLYAALIASQLIKGNA